MGRVSKDSAEAMPREGSGSGDEKWKSSSGQTSERSDGELSSCENADYPAALGKNGSSFNASKEIQQKGAALSPAVSPAVIDCLNGLIKKNDCQIEQHSLYERELQSRLSIVEGTKETQTMQIKVIEKEKEQKLLLLSESNVRAINRTEGIISQVERVKKRLKAIIAPTISLSIAQKNLISIITLLERFKSFLSNIDVLEGALMRHEYGIIPGLLLATQQLRELFQRKGAKAPIKFIDEQLGRFSFLEQLLNRQIFELFERTLQKRSSNITPLETITLGRAATIVDVLGGGSIGNLTKWYCERQLSDYREVFRSNRELCTLESVPKRFAWLKRLLIAYEAEHSIIFPDRWRVDFLLCEEFCRLTREDLETILSAWNTSGNDDLRLLQVTVQQTRSFEQFLYRKFEERSSWHGQNVGSTRPNEVTITNVFEPFLIKFVNAHDLDMEKFIEKLPKSIVGRSEEKDPSGRLLVSSLELFILCKEILMDISTLSVGKPLSELCLVLSKHLMSYAKYISQLLPGNSTSKAKPFSDEEVHQTCLLINTLDYCLVTGEQMSDHVRGIIDGAYINRLNCFESCKQEWLVHISVSISRLSNGIMSKTSGPVWKEMGNLQQWNGLKVPGDHCQYIANLEGVIKEKVSLLIAAAITNPKHYEAICERITKLMAKQFDSVIPSLGPISELMAQQLLVDLQAIRSTLLSIFPSDPGDGTSKWYSLVISETALTERTLKCLLAPLQPASLFVQNYLLIMADADEDRFLSVLHMKGLSRSTLRVKVSPKSSSSSSSSPSLATYLEEFRRHVPQKPSSPLTSEHPGTGREFKFFRFDAQFKKLFTNK